MGHPQAMELEPHFQGLYSLEAVGLQLSTKPAKARSPASDQAFPKPVLSPPGLVWAFYKHQYHCQRRFSDGLKAVVGVAANFVTLLEYEQK